MMKRIKLAGIKDATAAGKKAVAFILFTLFALTAASAQEYPYEWLNLSMSEDPATIQRVQWRTGEDKDKAYAELTIALPSPDITDNVRRFEVATSIENDYGLVKAYHRATFDNLLPGTQYLYRVGDGKKWSEWFEFTTAQAGDAPFSFMYISDVQTGIHNHYPRVIRQATLSAADASFVMFTGDLTSAATEWEWNTFFRSNGWLFNMKPVVPVPDSHEYSRKDKRGMDDNGTKHLTTYWNHMFGFPQNTPQELLEMGNYYFDYQNCRFLMINTCEMMDSRDEYREKLFRWMEEVLETNPHTWCIVGQHRPIYSLSDGRDSEELRNYLKPLYDKYGVDMVLTGHDHIYGRTFGPQHDWAASLTAAKQADAIKALRNTKKQDQRNSRRNSRKKVPASRPVPGPLYVVSVAGPQVYMPEYHLYVDRMASNTQLYHNISVGNDKIRFEAYTALGDLYDCFEIKKADGVKSFTDLTPEIPEITDMPTKTWQEYSEERLAEIDAKRRLYIESKK